ncbi:MAG: sigma-70 family RNA polymerase sigma factor [Leptolyngbyaceae cyanobacterium CSU_1_4]|nr:sigma-70 family RNA polymerase sigma factor [Leptolyngbyaceae cyanobacterium CSU_1_4]
MKLRQKIIEKFSTFAQFTNDRFSNWAIEPRLQRSMQREIAKTTNLGGTELGETFWVLYWYQCYQSQSLTLSGSLSGSLSETFAEGHLAAYLQETCYWAAHRLVMDAKGLELLPDCFQLAIATLPRVLQSYRSEQGASLKTYALLSFSNAIRDSFRQQQECSRRTDWGLLRKVSQKCLIEALQMAGQSPATIARYRLAWTSFKTLYAPTATRQLAAPDAKTWEAIAQLYQRHSDLSNVSETSLIHPEMLESWLKDCAKQVRAYLCPPITSLNIKKFEDGSGELQDDLPDCAENYAENTPMAALMALEELQERRAQSLQVSQILHRALEKLDPQMKTLLALYYSEQLTQQQIAQQLEIKQYTVSRRLSSTKEILLRAIAQWSQESLHITLTSPAIQQMSMVLEEWLQAHYQQLHYQQSHDPQQAHEQSESIASQEDV